MAILKGENHGEIEIRYTENTENGAGDLFAEQSEAANAALLDFVAQHPV
jgi:hypothetical protein